MTPDRRLDQVEPALAEGLQKIDRLVDGQGKLVDLATSTDQKADTTARGVATLTLKVDQIAKDQIELRREMQKNVAQVDGKVAQVDGKVNRVDGKVDRVDGKVDRVDDKVARVDEKVDSLRAEMNQRFDQLITLIQGRLS